MTQGGSWSGYQPFENGLSCFGPSHRGFWMSLPELFCPIYHATGAHANIPTLLQQYLSRMLSFITVIEV
jgi:hypothetical protein